MQASKEYAWQACSEQPEITRLCTAQSRCLSLRYETEQHLAFSESRSERLVVGGGLPAGSSGRRMSCANHQRQLPGSYTIPPLEWYTASSKVRFARRSQNVARR
jgi:hypothetical protein